MEAYATGVRVSATVFAFVGVTCHTLVFFLTRMKAKKDHSAYILLMQIYSCGTVLRILSGWFVINRAHPFSNGHTVIFSYGIGGLVQPCITAIVLSLSSQMGLFSGLCIPICMAVRAFILYNKTVTKKMIILVMGSVYGLSLVILVATTIIIMNSPVGQLPSRLLEEAKVAPPLAELKEAWEVQIWYAGSNSTYLCVPVTFILRYVMVRRLKQLNSMISGTSSRSGNLHKSFVTLLSFEASILLIGIFVTFIRWLAKNEYLLSAECGTILGAYSFPILLTMYMFQGIATLTLVPYLRTELLKPFAKMFRMNSSVMTVEYSTQK